MNYLKLLPVMIGLAMLPEMAGAADDVAALRAEMQALKSDYSARVDALETRIQQLEAAPAQVAATELPPPTARACRVGRWRCVRVQSRHLADPRRQLHEHVAQPGRLDHRRLSAERRRGRAR